MKKSIAAIFCFFALISTMLTAYGSWTDTTKATTYSNSHSVQLSSTGTYRAHIEFTISGTGGSNDELTKNVQRTYS